jgi:hypothetical protein
LFEDLFEQRIVVLQMEPGRTNMKGRRRRRTKTRGGGGKGGRVIGLSLSQDLPGSGNG